MFEKLDESLRKLPRLPCLLRGVAVLVSRSKVIVQKGMRLTNVLESKIAYTRGKLLNMDGMLPSHKNDAITTLLKFIWIHCNKGDKKSTLVYRSTTTISQNVNKIDNPHLLRFEMYA